MEVGTLKELDVKPGDVVECVDNKNAHYDLQIGRHYRCITEGTVRDDVGDDFPWTFAKFRIVSRAPDSPKLWRCMTDSEKGALLLAEHEGKDIEWIDPQNPNDEWEFCENNCLWDGVHDGTGFAYRVKPENVRETVPLYIRNPLHKKIGTIDLIDGVPDWDSIKTEKL